MILLIISIKANANKLNYLRLFNGTTIKKTCQSLTWWI